MSARDDVVRRIDTRNREHQQLMNERSVTIRNHTVRLSNIYRCRGVINSIFFIK